MLAAMIQKVHIDYEEVTTKYLCGTKEKRWDMQMMINTLKYFNLERIVQADLLGMTKPKELTVEDLIKD